MKYSTEQEEFWAGEFGDQYIGRNESVAYLASNLHFFSKVLKHVGKPESLIEFGANIGMNLKAIKQLYPGIHVHGVEINEKAAQILKSNIGEENVSSCSIFEYKSDQVFDVVLIKGVLIHINPARLQDVYQQLYDAASKYILLCEYYNPSPVTIPYRGNTERLFKRDFAGEMLETYDDLVLVDYGFVYKRDPSFPQDDVTWFLLKKN